MEFIYFLGRFHVLALHLPIGILLLVLVMEWVARKPKYQHLMAATGFLWGAAAITAIGTVVLGYMHFSEGGFDGRSAYAHRALGTALAVLTTAVWIGRSRIYALHRYAFAAVTSGLLVLLWLTGHFGGNLTHGDTFLVEYAPGPVRSLFGVDSARPKVTSLAMADPYLDVVRPIFAQRCYSCHNDDKRRGGLNLAHHDTLMKGGEKGVVVVAGKPEESDLYRRITLPEDHQDFMPKEGKTPLTAEQVQIIKWWIASGAVTDTKVSALNVPSDVAPLLAAQLGIGGGSGQVPSSGGSGQVASGGGGPEPSKSVPVDKQLVTQLSQAGFEARTVSQTDGRLIVNPLAFGGSTTTAQLAALGGGGNQIVELDLQRASINDDALSTIGKLTALTRLRLSGNDLTDRGVQSLLSLAGLEYLDLHGNPRITDKSLEVLEKLTKLKRVYLWQTHVSADAAAKLRQRRPDLSIDLGMQSNAPGGTAKNLTQNAR